MHQAAPRHARPRSRCKGRRQTRLSSGALRGGIPFSRGSLDYLLKNRGYVGEIIHKGKHHAGEHQPILDRELFDAVQEMLASQARSRRHARINNASILTGRIFDDRGNRMTPATGKKAGALYRYYVSGAFAQGRKDETGSVPRVSAPDIEAVVLNAVREQGRVEPGSEPTACERPTNAELIEQRVAKIIVRTSTVEITLQDAEPDSPLVVRWSPAHARPRRDIIFPEDIRSDDQRPIRSESRARLVEGIAKARLWLSELVSGAVADTREIAEREGSSDRSIRMTISLAFLNPALVRAAVDGTLPHGLGSCRLADLPMEWGKQIRAANNG